MFPRINLGFRQEFAEHTAKAKTGFGRGAMSAYDCDVAEWSQSPRKYCFESYPSLLEGPVANPTGSLSFFAFFAPARLGQNGRRDRAHRPLREMPDMPRRATRAPDKRDAL